MEVSPAPAFLVILVDLPGIYLFICVVRPADPLFQKIPAERCRSAVFPGAAYVPGLFADVLGRSQTAPAREIYPVRAGGGPSLCGHGHTVLSYFGFCAAQCPLPAVGKDLPAATSYLRAEFLHWPH